MAIDQLVLEGRAAGPSFRFTPSPLLCTPAGNLQGGAGLGVAVAAMEAVTRRPTIWATAQYLTFAPGLDALDVEVTVEVHGHQTTQARSVVQRDGMEILTAHAALGRRQLDIEGTFSSAAAVPGPEESAPFRFFRHGRGDMGDLADFRLARGRQFDDLDGRPGSEGLALWIRCWEGDRRPTAADLAFIGDFMPLGFPHAIGQPYIGNSLDNTVRLGNLVPTEWVLMTVHVQQVVDGFGHGYAELWSQDDTLLGTVSQSATLRRLAE
jgi:acyl-CoA thioesterase II